jgi:Ca-activated chloride channel family protein
MMTAPSLEPDDPSRAPSSSGGRLVSTTGRALPLLGSVLTAEAAGGIARVTLEQRFKNHHAEPLAVTYSLPLPEDGAVSGFSFRIGARRVVGEIDRRKAARARYERALVEGRTAALLEQERASLFTQEIGNIPPGEEVIVEVAVDQRLRWLDEGAWEWRFPTVVGPRYLGQEGRVPDADRVTQEVADAALGARASLSLSVRDALADGRRPESPSHAVEIPTAPAATRVELRDKAGARLDRDVVVRWHVATLKVGLALDTGRAARGEPSKHAHALLTVVPPSPDAPSGAVPRDLIVLLDTSGSMNGEPLAQAVRVASALVATLRAEDRLELIEFSSAPRRWRSSPVAATEEARREALAWLRSLRASGGTEMRAGILEALATLRADAQRQVVLITDGLIGFESDVVAAICERLPASSRLHAVGIGSSVNRSLTGPAARAGHGVEAIIGLGEDPERAAARIVARTNAPILVDLVLGGSALVEHAPAKLPDLFAGAPALVGVALRPEGGELTLRGRTLGGTWEQRLKVLPVDAGHGNPAVVALFGRETVEDLEMRLAAGSDARAIDASIERIGIDFQIATRLTSWVAISEERTVDPSEPVRRERMPHELPYGMSAEGLGLRAPMPMAAAPMQALAGSIFAEKVSIEARAGRARVPMPPGGTGTARAKGVASRERAAPKPVAEAQDRMRELKREDDVFDVEASDSSIATPPAPDAPKRRSLLGALRNLFAADEDVPAGAPAGRTLRGRIALKQGRELVIEVFAREGGLAWAPSGEARIWLAGGGAVAATIDAARSTKKRTLAAGSAARLFLEVAEGAAIDDVQKVTIELDGAPVTIDLS